MNEPTTTLPCMFISHGGGPWPWMPESAGDYAGLSKALQVIGQALTAPAAILMVSAHWEESDFTVMSHPKPPMIYDYGGFPAHTYQVRYPAPGAPQLATRVQQLLGSAGITVAIDPERGFDHGLYSPMVKMYPNADIPVTQLSLKRGLDPREHLAAGGALAPLRKENVLIVGSGLSYHNLYAFGPAGKLASAAFDEWLNETVSTPDQQVRERALIHWENAPSARLAHPREEHLLPLMIAAGAAGNDRGTRSYHEDNFRGGVSVSNFEFSAN